MLYIVILHDLDDEIAYLGPIVTKMTGNSAFTTLATKTTALGTQVTALSAANAAYPGGGANR